MNPLLSHILTGIICAWLTWSLMTAQRLDYTTMLLDEAHADNRMILAKDSAENVNVPRALLETTIGAVAAPAPPPPPAAKKEPHK